MTNQCPETRAEHAWHLKHKRYNDAYRVWRCAHCGEERVRPEVLTQPGRKRR